MSRRNKETLKDKVAKYIATIAKMGTNSEVTASIIVHILEEEFDLDGHVFTGQKRIVADVDDEVLKISYSEDSIDDNINELLTSQILLELRENGEISKSDLNMFAICEAYNGDPNFLVAPKITRFLEYKPFLEWYKEHKKDSSFKDYSKNEMLAHFIMTNKKFNEQHTNIIKILSKFTIASDVYAFKVPENYGINESADDCLCLLDMGSILPKYSSKILPSCDVCGRPKKLIVPEFSYKDSDKLASLMSMKTGVYGCTYKECSDCISEIKPTTRSNNSTDSIVFDKYQSKAKRDERFIEERAKYAHIFLPTTDIDCFEDYKDELIEDTIKFKRDEATQIYLNSLPLMMRDLIADEIDEIDDLKHDKKTRKLDFEDFKEELEDILDIEDNSILDLFAVIQFIQIKSDEEDVNAFDILMSEDKSEFISFLEDIDTIDEDDHDIMWDIVKTLKK
ncbi:MAG: hypothetical protein ACRCX2_36300 [Paraclostridium sp.]